MNTPVVATQPVQLKVEIKADITIKALHAFAAIALSCVRNQQIIPQTWHFLLQHRAYLQSLTEVCTALKIEPPATILETLEKMAMELPTLQVLQLRIALCTSATNSLAQVMTMWTMNTLERLQAQQKEGAGSTPIRLH